MKYSSALLGGLAGATALTILHETVRKVNEDAPRMDLLGKEAITKSLKCVHVAIPNEDNLFKINMACDIISNSLYYSFAGVCDEKQSVLTGALLGVTAGIGAVALPKPMGLDDAPSNRTTQTKLMTIGWYTFGGLIAGITCKLLHNPPK